MNRKISWLSNALDEIELVYEKAENNATIGNLLEKLELQALAEARANAGLMQLSDGSHMTPAKFDGLSDANKETLIRILGDAGLGSLDTDMASATITITLSPLITRVQACAFFSILNRIEKLDGAVNIISPKWTLELQAPLGGKKGLVQWEMLIMMLYPWISIREVSTTQMAVPGPLPID